MQRIPSYKEILAIAIPIMIGSISESISAVVDTAFMGHIGTLAIDGMGMTNTMLLMFMMMGWAYSRSIQILVSQNYGANKYENIGQVFFNGLMMMLPIGLLMFLLLYFFSSFFLHLIIANPDIHRIAHEICQIRAIGFPILMLTLLLSSLYTGLGDTKILMYSQGIGAITNIVLNYILVFGKYGMPAMGYRGSAIATVISEVVVFGILIGRLLWSQEMIATYYLFYYRKIKYSILREVSILALPMLVLHLFSLGAWVYFFSLIEKMGEKELAISMVLKQLFIAMTIPGFCLATTANTLVGRLVGSRDLDLILPTIFRVVRMSYMILGTLAMMCFVFRVPIVRVFTNDVFVIEHITLPLMALLSAYFFIPAANTLFNSVSALGNTRISLIMESSVVWIYLIYLYLSLSVFHGGLLEAWYSETLYWAILMSFGLIYFYRMNWKKNIVYLDDQT